MFHVPLCLVEGCLWYQQTSAWSVTYKKHESVLCTNFRLTNTVYTVQELYPRMSKQEDPLGSSLAGEESSHEWVWPSMTQRGMPSAPRAAHSLPSSTCVWPQSPQCPPFPHLLPPPCPHWFLPVLCCRTWPPTGTFAEQACRILKARACAPHRTCCAVWSWPVLCGASLYRLDLPWAAVLINLLQVENTGSGKCPEAA